MVLLNDPFKMEHLNEDFKRMNMFRPSKGTALTENNRWREGATNKSTFGSGFQGKENRMLMDDIGTSSRNISSNKQDNERHKESSLDSGRPWEGSRMRPGSSGSAPGRLLNIQSPSRVHTVELVGGLQSVEGAKDLHDACIKISEKVDIYCKK